MRCIRIVRLILFTLGLLCLGSCQVITLLYASFFPPTLTQATAQTDLTSLIPEEAQTSVQLCVAASGTPPRDFVFIFSRAPYIGKHVLVFDSRLGSPSLLSLDALPPGFDGRFSMTDFSGAIIFGNQVFDPVSPASGLISTMAHTSQNITLYEYSTPLPSENRYMLNFRLLTDRNIMFDMYDSGWAPSTVTSKLISSDPKYLFTLIAVYAHQARMRFYVLLGEKNSGTMICMSIPFGLLTGSSPVIIPPGGIFDVYPPIFTIPFMVKSDAAGFSGDSLNVHREDTREWVVYEITTGQVRMTLYDPLPWEMRTIAYSDSTSVYYVLENKKRTVTRYTSWWPR
jgi:hypothetical protein